MYEFSEILFGVCFSSISIHFLCVYIFCYNLNAKHVVLSEFHHNHPHPRNGNKNNTKLYIDINTSEMNKKKQEAGHKSALFFSWRNITKCALWMRNISLMNEHKHIAFVMFANIHILFIFIHKCKKQRKVWSLSKILWAQVFVFFVFIFFLRTPARWC